MPVDPEATVPPPLPLPHRRKLMFLFGGLLTAAIFFVAKQLFG